MIKIDKWAKNLHYSLIIFQNSYGKSQLLLENLTKDDSSKYNLGRNLGLANKQDR